MSCRRASCTGWIRPIRPKGSASLQSVRRSWRSLYLVLLYERFLRASLCDEHRDSVSELVGEVVEVAIKECPVRRRKISFRETKRAERIPGFDQTPDFIIPG